MVYTVTCNPALDCAVRLHRLAPGEMNRTMDNALTPSGKGINVSRVLTALGVPGKAIAFTAGETGALLETMLHRAGVETDFVVLPEGSTRINVKLHAETETELNAPGTPVDAVSLKALTKKLDTLKAGDVLCLCGSLPPGLPKETYATLLEAVAGRGVYTVLDAAGEALVAGLRPHPWLIKPNRQEMSELLGVKVDGLSQAAEAAKGLQRQGARHVLVSLGGEGALLCTEEGRRLYLPAPTGQVRGTVGSGDSMVAGFVTGWMETGSVTEALRMGVAAGSATAFAEGLADREAVYTVLEQVSQPTEL